MEFVADVSLDMPGSPESVFDRLADHPSWKEWMPKSFFPVGSSKGPLEKGSKPLLRIARLPVPNRLEVVVFERGRELTWIGGSPALHAYHRFLFEPREPGVTRVRSLETWKGFLLPVAKPLVKWLALGIGNSQLDALKRSLIAKPA